MIGYPTKDYISRHDTAYSDATKKTWAGAGYTWPRNVAVSLIHPPWVLEAYADVSAPVGRMRTVTTMLASVCSPPPVSRLRPSHILYLHHNPSPVSLRPNSPHSILPLPFTHSNFPTVPTCTPSNGLTSLGTTVNETLAKSSQHHRHHANLIAHP